MDYVKDLEEYIQIRTGEIIIIRKNKIMSFACANYIELVAKMEKLQMKLKKWYKKEKFKSIFKRFLK